MNQSADLTSSWGLAIVLGALASYHSLRVAISPRLCSRVSSFFQAYMAASMAAVVLRLGWPVLPQLILFALASYWYVVRAVSRATFPPEHQGVRLRFVYDAVGMAAAGLMILPLGPVSMPHSVRFDGHHEPAPAMSEMVMPDSVYKIGSGFFVVVAAAFVAAIGVALRRSLRKESGVRVQALSTERIFEASAEVLSAAAMAVMLGMRA